MDIDIGTLHSLLYITDYEEPSSSKGAWVMEVECVWQNQWLQWRYLEKDKIQMFMFMQTLKEAQHDA